MDYRISGSSKVGFGAKVTFSRRNQRRLTLLLCLVLCVVGVMIVIRVVQNAAVQSPVTADVLDGTWALESLNGDVIGDKSPSPILSQRISFREGKLRGE